jgi:hypothetical protein
VVAKNCWGLLFSFFLCILLITSQILVQYLLDLYWSCIELNNDKCNLRYDIVKTRRIQLYKMAKEINMQFSGRIGSVIGCLRDGKYYYRSVPEKVRQTKATRLSSNNFGLASKAGKMIRRYLAASIPNATDRHMHKRLAGSIANWLGLFKGLPPQPTAEIPFVHHFNFNPETKLAERWKIALNFQQVIPGLAELHIPPFVPVNDVIAPTGTTHLEFCINAVAVRLGDDTIYGSSSFSITMPYNPVLQDAQQVALPLETRAGNLLVVALQLRFGIEEAGQIFYNKHHGKEVAAIVGAVYL